MRGVILWAQPSPTLMPVGGRRSNPSESSPTVLPPGLSVLTCCQSISLQDLPSQTLSPGQGLPPSTPFPLQEPSPIAPTEILSLNCLSNPDLTGRGRNPDVYSVTMVPVAPTSGSAFPALHAFWGTRPTAHTWAARSPTFPPPEPPPASSLISAGSFSTPSSSRLPAPAGFPVAPHVP